MDISVVQIATVFIVALFASILSGMAGGGGGLIVVPFYIAFGLNPQQAIATAKFNVFGFSFGGIAAFKKKSFARPKLLGYLMVLALVISLIVPFIFSSLSGNFFQVAIGAMMIVLIPFILIEKSGIKARKTSRSKKTVGGVLAAFIFLLQGIFSSGIGSLNNLVLMYFYGLTSLEASALMRVASLALNTLIIVTLVLATDFIIWEYAIAGTIASFIGSYIGSRIAIKEGERFAKYALVMFMLISGIVLLAEGLNNT